MVDLEKKRMELSWVERINWLVEKLLARVRLFVGDIYFVGKLQSELESQRPLWVETFMHLWQEFYSTYASAQYAQFRTELGVKRIPPNMWKSAESSILAGVEKRVDQILHTTLQRWSDPDPWSESDLLDRVRTDMTDRRKLIAQVEVLFLVGRAMADTAFELGGDKFTITWRTMGDEWVRDSHAQQDGDTVPVGTRFPNGLLYPGDESAGDPKEFLGCRCVPQFQVRDDYRAKQTGSGEDRIQELQLPIVVDERPTFGNEERATF